MSTVRKSDSPRRGSREHLMQKLRRQLAGAGTVTDEWSHSAEMVAVFSSGSAAIDRLLPAGGLRHGMLVEWLAGDVAAGGSPALRTSSRTTGGAVATFGVATLSLLAAREACREGGMLVVLDRSQTFYPPAAAAWGIDLERLIVVRPRNGQDEQWAAVQTLRSPAVAAVWGAMDRLDSRAFRRLQLAAQAGRTLGLLLRPASARSEPSWADVRMEVSNCGLRIADCGLFCSIRNPKSEIHNHLTPHSLRRVHVGVLRTHGGRPSGLTTLEINDATYTVQEVSSPHDSHPLPVVAELADPADRSMPARA